MDSHLLAAPKSMTKDELHGGMERPLWWSVRLKKPREKVRRMKMGVVLKQLSDHQNGLAPTQEGNDWPGIVKNRYLPICSMGFYAPPSEVGVDCCGHVFTTNSADFAIRFSSLCDWPT